MSAGRSALVRARDTGDAGGMESTEQRPGSGRPIVVGIDGSVGSDRAIRWAAGQAGLDGRPLVLVHAVGPSAAATWMAAPGFNPATVLEAVEECGHTLLAQARSTVRAHDAAIEVRCVFDRRDARDALLDHAQHAAMVVVGSRGRGAMLSLLLGSVSLAVSQHASCPVVVVREDDPTGGRRTGVVVGTDATAGSDAALGFAFRHASARGLPVTVVHAFATGRGDRSLAAADRSARARHLIAESVRGLAADHPEVQVAIRVECGLPDAVVASACRDADLLVVGTHPTNALYDLLTGEVSRSALAHAKCAVAVVPDPM